MQTPPFETERRKFTRIPTANETSQIIINGNSYDGFIIDESISGFGITGLNVLLLAKDTPLIIRFRENEINCVCKHISRMEFGLRIGVERLFNRNSPIVVHDRMSRDCRFLIAPFIKIESMLAMCVPVELLSNGKLSVVLWNGMELEVDPGMIHVMTREERATQLGETKSFDELTWIYQNGLSSMTLTSAADVLEFEFGNDHFDEFFDCMTRCEKLVGIQ